MQKRNFVFRVFVYKDDATFTAVCLDLDIVEEGHKTLQQAVLSIKDGIDSHMSAAAELGFPNELIKRPAPEKYWKKLDEVTHPDPKAMTPFQYFTSTAEGRHSLYA
jgi:hypothetical protein